MGGSTEHIHAGRTRAGAGARLGAPLERFEKGKASIDGVYSSKPTVDGLYSRMEQNATIPGTGRKQIESSENEETYT